MNTCEREKTKSKIQIQVVNSNSTVNSISASFGKQSASSYSINPVKLVVLKEQSEKNNNLISESNHVMQVNRLN